MSEQEVQQQPKPPVLSIKMVPAGIGLVIFALRKLPHEQVDALVQEIAGQYGYQLQQLEAAAQKKPVEKNVAKAVKKAVAKKAVAKKAANDGAKAK